MNNLNNQPSATQQKIDAAIAGIPAKQADPDFVSPLRKKANPGSVEAGNSGCTCPVMDNNHGRYAPWPPDGWWMTAGCPYHHEDR